MAVFFEHEISIILICFGFRASDFEIESVKQFQIKAYAKNGGVWWMQLMYCWLYADYCKNVAEYALNADECS